MTQQNHSLEDILLRKILETLGVSKVESMVEAACLETTGYVRVRCNVDGQIVALHLPAQRLSGKIPPELGKLQSLERLILSSNRLTGEIPPELGQLKKLSELDLRHNRLTGPIPPDLGELKKIQRFKIEDNQLTGNIPSELGALQTLEFFEASSNQLSGKIPPELGQLQNLKWLRLDSNQLTGEIPHELGKLQKLKVLHLRKNMLTGHIPSELCQLKSLVELNLRSNQLTGELPELHRLPQLRRLSLLQNQLSGPIPREFGQMPLLKYLDLGWNRLTGRIPRELGNLQNVTWLDCSRNLLTGEIPHELGQLKAVTGLNLHRNQLTGSIPPELGQLENLEEICQLGTLEELLVQQNWLSGYPSDFKMPYLKVFDGSRNSFRGPLVAKWPSELTHLDLSHNKFVGNISSIADFFCSLSPVGGKLQELRLGYNYLTGELPSCLLRFGNLKFLSLNDNQFFGSIPEIEAPHLTVLMLHRNALTGTLPLSLSYLNRLGVLSLHENWIGGSISGIRMSVPCLDNSRFKFEGTESCGSIDPDWGLGMEERQQFRSNCPDTLGICPAVGLANLTLHHNRFSCHVPENITGTRGAMISGLVLMGNKLGDGKILNATWLFHEERQPFLFYSQRVWLSEAFILTSFLALVLCMALRPSFLQKKLHEASQRLSSEGEVRVSLSAIALLKTTLGAFFVASPLLLIFAFSGKYFDCSPPLWQTTIANHKAESAMPELAVIATWCALQMYFRSIIASMPDAESSIDQKRKPPPTSKETSLMIAAWFLWICLVTVFSLPSVCFTCAKSLPSDNAWELSDNTLQLFHSTAALQTVMIDVVLAPPLSSKFSLITGIKADRLLMTFRLFSAWLVAVATTAFLDENCFGGWKLAWKVCQAGSDEHDKFVWKIYSEDILNPRDDLCSLSKTWWSDGRCSRAMVGSLTPFLLNKLLIRTTVQPLALWILWKFSRLDAEGDPERGRHRRLLGIWPRTTGSLRPFQQISLMTTQLETLLPL
eukprot:Skav204455  [mRNA]  locus=scaffold1298:375227:378917:+ [translate_table: standard]